MELSKKYCFFSGQGPFYFFVSRDGILHGGGYNEYGQLGVENKRDYFKPISVKYFPPRSRKEVNEVALGESHSIFLTNEGVSYSCGWNEDGQLSIGNHSVSTSSTPLKVTLGESNVKVVGVYAGTRNSFFLTQNGEVFSCGDNQAGELGLGEGLLFSSVFTPAKIQFSEKISTMATGGTCLESSGWSTFLSLSHRVYFSGAGDCFTFDNVVPSPMEIVYFRTNGIRVSSLVANQTGGYFITDSKQVYGMGYAKTGQFGMKEFKQAEVDNELDGEYDSDFDESESESEEEEYMRDPYYCAELSNFELFSPGHAADFVLFVKNGGKLYGTGVAISRFVFSTYHFGKHKNDVYYSPHCLTLSQTDLPQKKRVAQIVTGVQTTWLVFENESLSGSGKRRQEIYVSGGGRCGVFEGGGRSKWDERAQFFCIGDQFDLKRWGKNGVYNKAARQKQKLERLNFFIHHQEVLLRLTVVVDCYWCYLYTLSLL